MTAYYNEFDPFAAAWLRELIKANLIAAGDVDERSITEVTAADLGGYTQCHFFAGIGGWSYALRLAGWPDDRPVWTGSCPCQPFSAAGKGTGTSDTRHLWPALFKLIKECQPSTVFGEQVASADGRAWIDLLYTDLEASNYSVGAANICVACVGAPHIRQRIYWVADSQSSKHTQNSSAEGCGERPQVQFGGSCVPNPWSDTKWIDCTDGAKRPIKPGIFPLADGLPARVGRLRGYGNAIVPQVAAEVIRAYMDVVDHVTVQS